MDPLVRAMSMISIVIAAALTQRLVRRLSRAPGEKVHPLASRIGGAVVFATIFVVIWQALGLVLVLPLVRSRAS